MFGALIDYKKNAQTVNLQFENGIGRIEVITDTIVRVFSGDNMLHSKAIEGDKSKKAVCTVENVTDGLVILTDSLTVHIGDDFKVDFYDKQNHRSICRDYHGTRRPQTGIGDEELALMAKEGHAATSAPATHKIEIVKAMDGDESFYGLGDKTGFLNKRYYAYEMWNTDDPSPQVDWFKVLYKSIPFFITLKSNDVYGIFFDNTYRSYFDMGKESENYFYFAADNGNLDYYFIAGKTMTDVVSGYTYLTGRMPVPQEWVLGYHQSHWSYKSETEVRALAKRMREEHIPCDTIHMDIDYMDNFKIFTWNKANFGDPKKMIGDLADEGFKIVTIIDPGIKLEEGYSVYDEGVKNGYFVTTPEGEIYGNTVWPGDAVYPDFGNPEVRTWWSNNHKFLTDLGVRGIWNDMNEPASFCGELPQDLVFADENQKSDHSRMHNVYGLLMCKATYEGLKKYDGRRPFVITRACYAGAQKYTTGWTGDNQSIWAHLQMAIPQLCNLSLSGMSFVGSDVGGFVCDTTPELLTRWVQVGCFSPLFRNHSAMDCIRQEPWCFGKEVLDIYRKFVQLRYKLIPYYYDLFFSGEKTGLPAMRPLVLHYPQDENVKNLNDEFLVGESLLVAPVVEQGAVRKMVYLPEGTWYDYWTGEAIEGSCTFVREAPLNTCPLYVKAGGILPTWPIQDYIGQKEIDTLELDVYLGNGVYHHYQDDGESFAYRDGVYNEYLCTLVRSILTVELVHSGYIKPYQWLCVHFGEETVTIPFSKDKIEVTLSQNSKV
jgi:alpha-glucosidase